MAKPRVFASHSLFDAARQILQETCEVEYWAKPERPPREEVLRRVVEKDGLICLLTEKINEELLRAAPKLRIAANVAVGFDNIDVTACTKRGGVATNTPRGRARGIGKTGTWISWLERTCGGRRWASWDSDGLDEPWRGARAVFR